MRRLFPLAVALLAAPAGAQTAEPAATTATYGNWTVSCLQAEGGKRCEMATRLNLKGADGQMRPLIDLAIGPGSEGAGLRLVVQVPSDVALREPVAISALPPVAEGVEPGPETAVLTASYLACLPGGCLADAALDAAGLAALQGAGQARVAFTVLNGNRKVVVPVEMTGFSDAWAALGLPAP